MQAENTIYVDKDGNELARVEDQLPNAVVVVDDPSQVEACGIDFLSQSTANRRSIGSVFLTDGLSDLWNLGQASVYGRGGSVTRGYSREGGWVSEWVAPVRKNIDGDFQVSINEAYPSGDPTMNIAGGLMRTGQGLVHTHPENEGLREHPTGSNNYSVPVRSPHSRPSGADINQTLRQDYSGGVMNIAIDPNNYHFYRSNTLFSVDRSFLAPR